MFKKENILLLQKELKKNNLKAYLILTSDPHDNEYISEYYLKERLFFAPFSGSAGTLLISENKAFLSTDGRYWEQAEKELSGTGITLIKDGDIGVPSLTDFIKQNGFYPLGINYSNISEAKLEALQNKGIVTKNIDFSYLLDKKKEKSGKIFALDKNLYTLSYKDKIELIKHEIKEKDSEAHLLTTLDDIAFTLNLRGKDIPFNPVFYSYLYISLNEGVHLFVDLDKLDFSLEGVNVHPYEEIFSFIKARENIKTLIDPTRVNAYLYSLLKEPVISKNPSYLMKAIKRPVEIKNIKSIQEIDGLALLKFQKYLEDNLDKNLTEYDYSLKLKEFREESNLLFDLSFNTIASVGKNAAMMHYAPKKDNSSTVNKDEIEFLVDSGGQYFGGTTDTTRTFLIGKANQEFIHDYTLTLKALIAISSAVFLEKSDGHTLDILARRYFWNEGMDYKCGTGHGVGYILNVHEGPNGLRYKAVPERDDQAPIVPGMITTIEPGVYKSGKYGIRIENNLLCVKAFSTSDGNFFKFETITYVPIETKCLDLSIMSDKEVDWLNNYHKLVFSKLSPLIKDNDLLEFLKSKTKEIHKNS